MTDILDLKGWTVLGRTEEDGADVLEAEYPLPMPTACPKCGTLDCIYRHGTKATTYVDIPMRGKPAAAHLRAVQRRFPHGGTQSPEASFNTEIRIALLFDLFMSK